MIDTKEWQKQLAKLNKEKTNLQIKSNQFVRFRLLAFLIVLAGIAAYYKVSEMTGYFVCGAGVILFIYFVYKHNLIKKQQLHNRFHIQVIQRYIDRRNDEWMNFAQKGDDFLAECDPTFLDLDIIGNHSLYQLICCAKSALGKRRLYEYFADTETGMLSEQQLLKRRDAIEELSAKKEAAIDLQIALEQKDSQPDNRIEINQKRLDEFCALNQIAGLSYLRFLPILTLLIGALYLLSLCPAIIFYTMLMIQLLISVMYTLKESKRISCYQGVHSCFAKDAYLYKKCEDIHFEKEYLRYLQEQLIYKGKASKLLKSLDTSLSMFSLRNNIILYIVFNCLFMFDVQYLYVIEKWRKNHANNIQGWCEALGEIEALLSCSLLVYARDVTCIPDVQKGNALTINALHCGHPLINEREVVHNDYSLAGNSIITGSNMSGKSTFMRCVGLNVILANAGCRVCADTFSCSYMHVISSMRLKDELSSGISSFYAEVLRVKAIMEASKGKQPMLILIDEIFKGTNSIDRISGAKEIIRKLSQPWIISIITTHDLELCDEMSDIHNYHFKEHYIENEIHFDYLLRKGKCTTTNAIHLMKMAGIID